MRFPRIAMPVLPAPHLIRMCAVCQPAAGDPDSRRRRRTLAFQLDRCSCPAACGCAPARMSIPRMAMPAACIPSISVAARHGSTKRVAAEIDGPVNEYNQNYISVHICKSPPAEFKSIGEAFRKDRNTHVLKQVTENVQN